MNKIHKLVWSIAHQGWVAASEVASAVGARRGSIARRLRRLAALTVLMSGASMAQTAPAPSILPQGGHVVQGQATLQGAGTSTAPVLNVNQSSQRAVVDWQSFNIGSAATVNFNQPDAQSATLNRVRDVNPSRIFGRINAPGQVTLMNPNGVYFSSGAVLDVGALTATTMQQSDADFMAGKASFTRSGSTASVVNEGTLQSRLGGYIALLAPEVRNEGLIVARQGTVALASGEAVQLHFDAASRLTSLTVTPGQIAALVENKTAVQVGEGQILLSATAVSGLQGSVINSGSLSASSLVSKGGRIVLEADAITLGSTSTIDASGATGGGTVLVGGDWHGAAGTHQASTVTMAEGASIDASATQQGDGGKVVLWSNVHATHSLTTAQGRITARGGAAGGNGGSVETSGHQADIGGLKVDAGAANGQGGLWLIDPADSTITQAVANSYQATLDTGTSVIDDVAGDIHWGSGVSLAKTAGGSATLTLRTSNSGSIFLDNASITSTSGALNLALWTRYDSEGNEGRISLGNSTISTHGGSVWMGGGNTASSLWNGMTVGGERASTFSADQQGVAITGSSISTGTGGIQIKGLSDVTGSNSGTNNFGVWINAGSSLTTTSGNIDLQGDVKGTYTSGLGVIVGTRSTAGNVTLASGSGAINITGTATDQSGSGSGWRHGEMLVANNAGDQISVRSTSGAITLSGAANATSTSFTTDSSGVQLQTSTPTSGISVVSQTGAISLLGSAALESSSQGIDAIRFAAQDVANSIRIGYDGINPYSGNILLQGDSILQSNNNAGAGSLAVRTSGTLTMQSAGNTFTYLRAGNSGSLSFDDDWNFGTSLSGLTIGKSTSTLGLTLSSPLSVAGSVDITAGRIALNASLSKTSGSDATLTMRATGDIAFSGAGINATSGKLDTVLIADWDSANGGAIYLDGGTTALTINTNGGQFWAGGNGYAPAYGSAPWNGLTVGAGVANSSGATGVFEGVNLNRVAVNTGGGNVSIAGRNARYNNGENRYGVLIQNGTSINSGSGSIAVSGSLVQQSGTLTTYPVLYGVAIANSTLQASTGSITVSGSENAGDLNNNWSGYGVQLYDSTVKTTGTSGGNISITGATGTDNGDTSSATRSSRYGVQLFADGASAITQVSSVAGDIAISGTANVTNDATSAGIGFKTAQPSNADATNPVVKVVSQTGKVTLTGDAPNNASTSSSGIAFDGTNYGKYLIGYDGTNAYSGTTTLGGRSVTQGGMAPGYLSLGGSGALAIEPLGNSFVSGASSGQNLTFDASWNFGSSHGSLRLGKDVGSAGHVDSITVSNAVSAAGPISVYGNDINLNANLTATAAGAAILAKGSGSVTTGNYEVLQTNGGAITLWADSDGSGSGYILLNESTKLDSRTAAARTANVEASNATTASGGGDITLGGGSGATATSGYAASAGTANRGGVNLGDQTWNSGAHSNLTTIYSGGGNVVMRGQQTGGSMMGINWVNGGTVNAGTGTVSLAGQSTGGHGVELASWRSTGSVNIYASGGSAGAAAISVSGITSDSGSSNGEQGVASLQANGAGGITLTGRAGSSSGKGLVITLDALAASGAIDFDGGTYGINLGSSSFGSKAGSNVTASSSNITFTGDSVALSSGSAISTTGALTVQPYGSNFSSALNWPGSGVTLASTVSAMTLGKDLGSTAHTDTINLANAASIAGPINLYAGTINLNANLSSTAAGAGILAKSSGNIVAAGGEVLQSNGGAITLWADSDGSGAGCIDLVNNNTLDSRTAAARTANVESTGLAGASGGGDITLAGGSGATAASGYAVSAGTTGLAGVNLGDQNNTSSLATLYSGGGNVLIRGRQSGNSAMGVQWINGGVLNAGVGTVRIDGLNQGSGHGIELGAFRQSGELRILAGGGNATTAAIDLRGIGAATGNGIQTTIAKLYSEGAGGISITGTAGASAPWGVLASTTLDAEAVSGPITINAGSAGISTAGSIAALAGSPVPASSSDVTMTADRLQFTSGFAVRTTGKLAVQPFSQSFSSALNWPPTNLVALAPTLGGLTLGKDGNSADITMASAANIAGPIDIFGGNVALNADLISTLANAPIRVKAGGNITSNTGRTFQTNNGDLIFWSNAGNGGTAGAQGFGDANRFNTANGSASQASGGGRIVMAGGLDDGSNGGTAGDGTPDGAAASSAVSGITIATPSSTGTTSLYSGGGNIVLRGSSTASGAAGIGVNKNSAVSAGNGTVSLSGNASQGHGIELGAYGGSTGITAGGGDATRAAIAVVGTSTSNGMTYSGVQASGGTMQATGAGGISVTGSATGSTYVNGATNIGTDVLAASGPIAITAIGSSGLRYGGTLGQRASSNVTASSANLTLTADALTVNGSVTADTSGSLTVQPYGASFGSALAWGTGITLTPTVSALVLGKVGNTAAITVGSAQSIAGPVTVYGGAVTVNQNLASSAAGDITLFADTLAFGASGRLASTGNLDIAPTTAGRTIGVGGGSGLLSLAGSFFTSNFVDGFAGITIGNTGSGAITAGTATTHDALTLRNGSAGITITGALNTGANTLALASSGNVAESGAGAIVAANLALLGGNVTLNGGGNDVGTVAGSGLGTLSYTDSNALTIGTVGATAGLGASGTISVATATGDLTLAQSVVTADAGNAAVVLNAGQAAAAGSAAGGDLKLSGNPAVTTGAGGRATLYTGSLAGSTGLSNFIGSGSGRFRYDSDETTSHYSAALAAAAFAVYREQPTLTITPASSTITYGDALPALATASNGAVNGDLLAVSASVGGGTSTSGHATAGSHAFSGSSADATALGYAVSSTAATLTVAPKALTISGLLAGSKVYDGNTAATVDASNAVYAGLLSGDLVSVSASGSFADKNVGTAKLVSLTSNQIGVDAGNYSVVDQASSSADITAKGLTVTGSSAASKVYDGNTIAAVSGGSLAGVVGGDAVTLAEAGHFATANAGTAIAVTTSDSLGGAGAGNYTLAQPTGLAADITPKALTVSGSVVAGKVYDRTTTATVSGGTLQGVVAGDSVALLQAGDFASANAGTAIAVTASDVLVGAAANYTLVQPTGLSADITPKALTVSGSSADSKVYDRTTTAIVSGGMLQGVIAGDNVTLAEAGNFASANAGTAIAVTASDALVGANGNYTLVQPIGLLADITPKIVSVTGSLAANKIYDGNTMASISGGALQGVIAGDSLTLTQAGSFASANAGNAIAVTIGDSLSGAAAGNYLLTQPAALAADITPKPLTLQGTTGVDKTYDGRNDLHATGHDPLAGVAAGDSVVLQGAPVYASTDAGQQAILQGSLALGGASAGNYTLGWINGSGTITPAALTIAANNDARFVTQPDGAGYNGVSYSGFVNGETAAVLGGSLAIQRSNAATTAAGAYAGVLVPSGATAANYSISFLPGSYTIVPANQLLVKLANTQTTYGNDATYAVTEARYLAADNSTIVDLTGSTTTQGNRVTVNDGAGGVARFTLAPANAALSGAGALKAGSYQLAAGTVTGSSANFGHQMVVIGAQQVSARGITLATSGATKVYDGSTAVSGLQLGAVGLAGDALSASGQGSFSDRNVGTGLAYSVTGLRLAGADAGNYFLAGGSTQAANDGAITPRLVTLTAPGVSRVYDGSAVYVADAAMLSTLGQGLVAGDALNGVSLLFDDKNVGTGKTLTASGAQIADGNNGANYRVSYVADHASRITRLDSTTWIGGATGNWFDAANWAGGAVPDLANVANVVIPSNVTVTFGLPGAVAPVRIDSLASGGLALQGGEIDVGAGGVQLASLDQSGGGLTSRGDVALGSFTQGGGALVTAGNFSTSEAFSQTSAAGSVTVAGSAHIANTSSPIWLGNLSSGSLSVSSSDGAIAQQPGTALVVQGRSSFVATNANGTPADITLDGAGSRLTGQVSASGADVTVIDAGPLSLGQVTASGDLTLQSQGALDIGSSRVGGSLTANSHGGNVSQSGPVVVGGSTRIDVGAGSVRLMSAGNRFGGGLQIAATGSLHMFDASSAAIAADSATQAAGATQAGLSARAEAAERAAPADARPATVIQLQPISDDSAGLAQVQLAPAPSGTGFTFALPAPSAQALRDSEGSVVARLADGGPLPDWLMFDAERLSFSAVAVPPDGLPIDVVVQAGAARLRVQVVR